MLIVLPLSWLVYYSLTDAQGAFTLDNFVTARHRSDVPRSADHDFILATSSASICCAVAAPMGWLVARTDMPLRRDRARW